MAHNIPCAFRILCVFLLTLVVASVPTSTSKDFDVRTYGARGDGNTDNTDAFNRAWKDACQWKGNSKVYVPSGTFYLRNVIFLGPCKGSINFIIEGKLLAPKNPDLIKENTWIVFRYVDNLSISGGGTLDGQGAESWPHNDCHKNTKCRTLPVSLGFDFVKHSSVNDIKSLNSKMGHIQLFAVEDFNVTKITVTAPRDSPNTDGIKIGASKNLRISQSTIGTGDDCVAILGGSDNIEVSDVTCGPGHGISVGSLGRGKNEKDVTRLTVRDSIFKHTSDGVRIKTWESSEAQIKVSDFLYENLNMIDVKYPINIDQQYCPYPPCHEKSPSHVQIERIKFKNIYGTSTSKEAVKLNCSKKFPCTGIELHDINLVNKGSDGTATAICENVKGSATGKQIPPSCIR